MGARMRIITRLLPRVAGVILSSGPVIKASKAFLASLRKGYEGVPDEKMKGRLVDLELRMERLEAALEGVERSLNRVVAAIFLIGGIALAALLLAIIKLA